jgi:diguanylate cyclase (GGDEF)-like protein
VFLYRLASIFIWFTPPHLQADPVSSRRVRNLLIAVIVGLVVLPLYAGLFHFLGHDAAAIANIVVTILISFVPFVLKASANLTVARKTFFVIISCLITWVSYQTGGIFSPVIHWIIVLPILAVLLGGMRSGLIWSIVSMLCVIALYLLEILQIPLPYNPITAVRAFEAACTSGLIIVVIILCLLFELNSARVINKLHKALQTIEELAVKDELTGIYNRRQLLKTMEEARNRAQRNTDTFCLSLIDIDHFKHINDTYGHSIGDEVLKRLAAIIQLKVRKTDCFGRYGGEEFLLILEGSDIDAAVLHSERIREYIENTRFPELPHSQSITISIGVAAYSDSKNIQDILDEADVALYKAKREGRNRVETIEKDIS